ncbi:OmpA family protein [Fulvivirgaceae bacterium BMA10]|uniref:OmpA family protein n=1 Tax=Splendidivirga corallicola TaxID=3051826 RepID=A0ABT8KSJ0_9BACT|nr:OmpA family protein [Fulvivirgaceae bacterium BMA10]
MRIVVLGVIAFLLWSSVTIRYYVCNIMLLCRENAIATETTTSASAQSNEFEADHYSENFVFHWGKHIPVDTLAISEIKTNLLQKLAEDSSRRLKITGFYYGNENNQSGFDNLGLARANSIKELLKNTPYTKRVSVASVEHEKLTEPLASPFEAIDFDVTTEEMKVEEKSLIFNDFEVEELEGKIIIYFPSASVNPSMDTVLNRKLDVLVQKVMEQGKTVSVTGHADNTGTEALNNQYGMNRANTIKDMLVSKGFLPANILVSSKGDREPIADNTTVTGRKKNRRVEITIQ